MSTYFISIASLLFLTVLVFWLYQDYRIDAFRQKMLDLRDELFDYAADGRIGFDEPAYIMMRSTMNGFIRFAHRLSLLQIIAWVIAYNKRESHVPSYHEILNSKSKKLTDEQRTKIHSIHMRMNFHLIRHLVFSSPILLITVIAPISLARLAQGHMEAIIKTPTIDKVDNTALKTGQFCQPA